MGRVALAACHNLHVADAAEDLEEDVVVGAFDADVEFRFADAQAPEYDFVDERRQHRAAEGDAFGLRLKAHAEAGL